MLDLQILDRRYIYDFIRPMEKKQEMMDLLILLSSLDFYLIKGSEGN